MSVELGDSYEAIYQRAIEQVGSGDTEGGIESLWRIVNRLARLRADTLEHRDRLRTTLLRAWLDLLQVLRRLGRYDEAIRACEAVRHHLPSDAAAKRIAILTIERGDPDEGLAQLRSIAEELGDAMSWADLGNAYLALGELDEAESSLQTALRTASSDDDAITVNLGLLAVYQQMGRVMDALNAWSMAVVLDPDLGDRLHTVVRWLIERDSLDLAERYLHRERNAARRAFLSGLLASRRGDAIGARNEWARVLDMDIEDAETDVSAWAEAALRLGQPARALEAAASDRVVNEPLSADATALFGIASVALGQVDQAHAWFGTTRDRLMLRWLSGDRIDLAKWDLLESLVADSGRRDAFRAYFEEE